MSKFYYPYPVGQVQDGGQTGKILGWVSSLLRDNTKNRELKHVATDLAQFL